MCYISSTLTKEMISCLFNILYTCCIWHVILLLSSLMHIMHYDTPSLVFKSFLSTSLAASCTIIIIIIIIIKINSHFKYHALCIIIEIVIYIMYHALSNITIHHHESQSLCCFYHPCYRHPHWTSNKSLFFLCCLKLNI